MITLFTGGRSFSDDGMLKAAVERWVPSVVVVGDASGLDAMVRAWAMRSGIPLIVGHANWDVFGLSAGPRRNAAMLKACRIERVLAFPGGVGTANCVAMAKKHSVEVILVASELSKP